MRDTKYKSGFSLIEVLIAILLIGLAVASLVAANSVFTKANGAGTDLSTAEFIIGQIRELTMLLPVIDPQGVRVGAERELVVWSSVVRSFHESARFGRLQGGSLLQRPVGG